MSKIFFAKKLYARILQSIAYRLGIRLSIVRAKAIQDSGIASFEREDYHFRFISNEELLELSNLSALDLDEDFIKRSLQRDDQCLGAFHKGDLVGYSWRTSQPVQVDKNISMSFSSDCYYRYKGFVLPEHRGKGLLNAIKSLSEKKFIDAGAKTSISCIETHNSSSLAASKNGGDHTIGYSAYMENRFGFWSWSSSGAKRYEIKIYPSY